MSSSVIRNQFFDKTDAVLEESLNQRLKKHMVNVSNVANSMTPGYRALGYDFESQLQAAVDDSGSFQMKTDDPRHIKMPGLDESGTLKPDLYVKPTESIGNDGNTVDVDMEMTEIASNQILYKAGIEIMNRRLGMIRYGINGGR